MHIPPLLEGIPPSQLRLGGFIALSFALHLLTGFGVGPLVLSPGRPGDGAQGVELHATLAPGRDEQRPPAFSTSAEESAPAKEQFSAPETGESTARPENVAESTGGIGLPSPETWYTARELDVRAEPLTEIRLHYPAELRGEPVVGRVHLRLFIDERGVVRKMEIADSRPSGMFDAVAKKAWEDVRFSPAMRKGVAVKSQKVLELTYEPGLM